MDYSVNFDINFQVNDIIEILNNLDPDKSPGPDKVHGKILKHCAPNLALPLTILFNTSYYTCKIPNNWKAANVVAIFKKKSKNNAEYYRPISLTNLIKKVYERLNKKRTIQKGTSQN